jgi:CRISPR-associated protein Cas2
MSRRRYLVTYDISDDKRRTAVFRTLRDSGDHAQYSVFFCELDRAELALLKARLDGLVNHDHDQVLILDLGPRVNPLETGLQCIGRVYQAPARVLVV